MYNFRSDADQPPQNARRDRRLSKTGSPNTVGIQSTWRRWHSNADTDATLLRLQRLLLLRPATATATASSNADRDSDPQAYTNCNPQADANTKNSPNAENSPTPPPR